MSERFLRSLAAALRFCLLPVFLAAAAVGQTSPDPGGVTAIPAAVPVNMVRYSAVLPDGSGAVRSGVVTLTFSLYSDPYTGSSLWSEQQSVSVNAEGRYTVLLGAATPLNAGVFPSGEQRWLGVQVGGDPELPRVLLASQPYAITASNADQLGGYPAGDYVLQSQLPGDFSALQGSCSQAHGKPAAADCSPNAIPKANAHGELVNSTIYESNGLVGIGTTNPTQALQLNGNLLLTGQTTHEVQLTGAASTGRFGQDLFGPFLSSDTPGKAIRFYTSGLNERARITDAGAVGIGTVNPTAALEVAGAVKISGTGSGLTFPDGSTQTTAAFPSALVPGTPVSNQEVESLVADQSATIGETPSTNGQVVIMPDNLDSVHSYIGQAGQQTHFRLSRAAPDGNGATHFMITPYLYGMGIEYPGVIEVWSHDFSVHMNHQLVNGTSANFWVGDEIDSGGLFATSFDNGGGSNSYTVLASDRFSHASHGPLVFQVRNPGDTFKFQWGAYNSEVTRAAFANSSTATSLALAFGVVQSTMTADSAGNGAVNIGSVSATPVNLVAGNLPQLTVFPDGNVSMSGAGDTAPLAVGSGSPFTVSSGGAVTASAVNTTALTAGSLSVASLNATSLNAANLNAAALSATTLNSGAEATSSLTLGGGTPILAHLSTVSTLSFPSFPANGCLTQTVSLPGTSDGDTVALGIPNVLGAVDGVTWFGWASAQDTVSIRGCNATSVATATPAPATVRIDVWKH
jgi:hypothetical protein